MQEIYVIHAITINWLEDIPKKLFIGIYDKLDKTAILTNNCCNFFHFLGKYEKNVDFRKHVPIYF